MSVRPCDSASVRVVQLGSHWVDFHEILYLKIFQNLSKKFKLHENQTRITGTLHEDQHTFSKTTRSVLRRMKYISDKCAKKVETHILCLVTFFLENRVFYEIMWKNFVELGGHGLYGACTLHDGCLRLQMHTQFV